MGTRKVRLCVSERERGWAISKEKRCCLHSENIRRREDACIRIVGAIQRTFDASGTHV